MNRGEPVGLVWHSCKLTARAANRMADRIAERLFPGSSQQAKWTAVGVLVGLAMGGAVGWIGIAALGTGFGLPSSVVLMFVGGLVGNRWGIWRDKKISKAATVKGQPRSV